MKICVLVKEVPDAAVEKRIDPSTGRLDRSGEKNLNPFDTHAIEAARRRVDALLDRGVGHLLNQDANLHAKPPLGTRAFGILPH